MLTDRVARELALSISLELGPEDGEALAPLVDASLVWLGEGRRAQIAAAVAEELWPRELREDVERGLDGLGRDGPGRLRGRLAAARDDLARGPRESRLARAVVDQAADQLAFDLQLPVGCPHCLDEGIARADAGGRRRSALLFARMAGHAARIPADEARAAAAGGAAALELATDERRADVRRWLQGIALLGGDSIPHASAALLELLDGPLPQVEDDEVWAEAVAGLGRRVAIGLA